MDLETVFFFFFFLETVFLTIILYRRIERKGLGKRKRQGTYETKESQVSIIRQNRIQAIGKAMIERIFMYDFSPEIFN